MFRQSIVALIAAVSLASFAGRADTDAPESEPDQLLFSYRLGFGGRTVEGAAHELEWSLRALAGNSGRLLLRIPVAALSTGHSRLDEALRRAMGEPGAMLELEGIATSTGSSPALFTGTLRLHGISHPLRMILSYSRAGEQLAVSSRFELDLDAFEVALPVLDGVRASPQIPIEFSALLSAHPGAVASGGFVRPTAAE